MIVSIWHLSLAITVTANVLTSNGVMPSAGTVLTYFRVDFFKVSLAFADSVTLYWHMTSSNMAVKIPWNLLTLPSCCCNARIFMSNHSTTPMVRIWLATNHHEWRRKHIMPENDFICVLSACVYTKPILKEYHIPSIWGNCGGSVDKIVPVVAAKPIMQRPSLWCDVIQEECHVDCKS